MKDYRSMHFKLTLGAANSVTFPSEACALLGAAPGDELLVLVQQGHVVIMPKPEDFAAAMRELCPEMWQDGIEYLKEERDSW